MKRPIQQICNKSLSSISFYLYSRISIDINVIIITIHKKIEPLLHELIIRIWHFYPAMAYFNSKLKQNNSSGLKMSDLMRSNLHFMCRNFSQTGFTSFLFSHWVLLTTPFVVLIISIIIARLFCSVFTTFTQKKKSLSRHSEHNTIETIFVIKKKSTPHQMNAFPIFNELVKRRLSHTMWTIIRLMNANWLNGDLNKSDATHYGTYFFTSTLLKIHSHCFGWVLTYPK